MQRPQLGRKRPFDPSILGVPQHYLSVEGRSKAAPADSDMLERWETFARRSRDGRGSCAALGARL